MKTKRVFIGIFGRRNQGKSSLINAVAGQNIAIVSDIAGTTTDPVKKTIEIFGIGPVVLVDTAGIDDCGELGLKRKRKTEEVLKIIDVAVLVISDNLFSKEDEHLLLAFQQQNIPFAIVHNKADVAPLSPELQKQLSSWNAPVLECSAEKNTGIQQLVEALVKITPPSAYQKDSLIGDLVQPRDLVVLVMPQDDEAPEGRLILPQVQVIRDLLDYHAIPIALQPEELSHFLSIATPKLVITDSQAFDTVSKNIPEQIPLTSFSIILVRAKGFFDEFLKGTKMIDNLKDNDKILILESCTHITSCEDIGRHKIPHLLQKVTQKKLQFDFISALDSLPENLSQYALAIQCGGCMVTKRQLQSRMNQLVENNIPISNYGLALAYLTGIFDRVTKIFQPL